MAIYSHIESFFGLDIEQFNTKEGIADSSKAIRIEVDYEDAEDGQQIEDQLKTLANDKKASEIKALIIGTWEEPFEYSIQTLIDLLIEYKDSFRSLKAVFFGEMTSEQNEISWIQQGNYSEFWAAYPQLEHAQIRGAEGLNLGDISLPQLKTFIIESGGLNSKIIDQVANAELPELNHLELWFGDENYGWDGDINTIKPFLTGSNLPKLTYLGLMNSEISDEIAAALSDAPILKQLHTLDLSMGTLSNIGGKAILENQEHLQNLKQLNLSHHYMTEEVLVKLDALPFEVDFSGMQEEDDEYRYVEVSE